MTDQPTSLPEIVVLGLGNVLYADEGIGVHTAEYLYKQYEFPAHVQIVDAGTRGMALLPLVESADRLLLVDAVDFSLAPGEVVMRENGHIPAYLTAQKMSVHQNSVSEILGLAQLRDHLPAEIVLVGMQPVDLSFGAPLSSEAFTRMPQLANMCLDILLRWGVTPLRTTEARYFHHPALSPLTNAPAC